MSASLTNFTHKPRMRFAAITVGLGVLLVVLTLIASFFRGDVPDLPW